MFICLNVSKFHPSIIVSYGGSSSEAEPWREASISPNYCSAVLCSSTVSANEMQVSPYVAVKLGVWDSEK